MSSSHRSAAVSSESPAEERRKKFHHYTVCMVPPEDCWDPITRVRTQLRDPGLYRWPPHVNLLYPFLDVQTDISLVLELAAVASSMDPFPVTLDRMGTFGGAHRGVLWLHPESAGQLEELQTRLIDAFPDCDDQQEVGGGTFAPHMTLSHFESLEEAQNAQANIDWKPLTFELQCIYVLHRKGDDGQFVRVAELPLGSQSSWSQLSAPTPFDSMPETEADWIRDERRKLKQRRNKKQRRRRSNPDRVPDTPEVIAAKRAARQAKRDESMTRESSS